MQGSQISHRPAVLLQGLEDYRYWKDNQGQVETHWEDLIRSGLRQVDQAPAKSVKRSTMSEQGEYAYHLYTTVRDRSERLRLWAERFPGVSESTMNRAKDRHLAAMREREGK